MTYCTWAPYHLIINSLGEGRLVRGRAIHHGVAARTLVQLSISLPKAHIRGHKRDVRKAPVKPAKQNKGYTLYKILKKVLKWRVR